MKAGEAGKGLHSRWYPQTLARRIADIAAIRERVTFIEGDGIQFLRENCEATATAFFIDPPYTVAGRRLYRHSELDHGELFRVTAGLRGEFLMTYDDTAAIRALAAEHGFDTERIAMKTTHHGLKQELLIGRDLEWVRR